MPKKLLEGYLLSGAETVEGLENGIFQVREAAMAEASVSYHTLVALQAERIVDEVALNILQRPDDRPILAVAENEVQRRILYADQNSHHTQYNLHLAMRILVDDVSTEKKIYLKTETVNELYLKRLDKVKPLTRFDITQDDIAAKKEKARLWEIFSAKYEKDIPLFCNIVLYDQLVLNPNRLLFHPPVQRAKAIATEKILNHLLSCYGCNQNIPPQKLMEFTMMANERIKHADMQEAIEIETDTLSKLLPKIDLDMVLRPPKYTPERKDGESREEG